MARRKQTDEAVDGLTPLEQPSRFIGQASHHGYVRVGPIEKQEFALAPGRQEMWCSIRDEEQALQALLTHVSDYVTTQMRKVVRRRRQWWDTTMADFQVSQMTHEASTDGITVSVSAKASKQPTHTKPMSSDELEGAASK